MRVKKRAKKWQRVLVGLLIFFAVYGVYRGILRARVNARIDAIRSAGYPVTLEELNDWQNRPTDVDNAADVMGRAFEQYEWENKKKENLPVVGYADLPDLTEPLGDDTRAMIAEYLADNAETMKLLHAAVKIEHCRYPVDYSEGYLTPLPHLGMVRDGARLLLLEAIMHAEDNEPDAAVKSVAGILGVGRTMADVPEIVSHAAAIASRDMAIDACERVMNRTALSDTQLTRLQKMFFDAYDPCGLVAGLIGERFLMVDMCRWPLSEMTDYLVMTTGMWLPKFTEVHVALYRLSGLQDLDAVAYLDGMSRYMNVCRLPLEQRWEAARRVEEQVRPSTNIHLILNLMGMNSMVVEFDIKNSVKLHAAGTAIAVRRFGLAHGRYPETLDELVPEYLEAVPVDLFDAKPLRYKKVDEGFVVYSVGENGVDDGGQDDDEVGADDVAFRMERGLGV